MTGCALKGTPFIFFEDLFCSLIFSYTFAVWYGVTA